MILSTSTTRLVRIRIPRESGDDPAYRYSVAHALMYSPRERG